VDAVVLVWFWACGLTNIHSAIRPDLPNVDVSVDDLHSWKVSVLARTGLRFAFTTASGKLMLTIMAVLAEFERDLIRERVKSGLAAANARGVALGRQEGQRPSDKKANRVLAMHRVGLSYRLIGRNVGLSKNTVMEIVRRGATA
jgi:DNA invertase Pin-like site-specific DNA recombinase